jgi:hypothetical protein
LIKVAPTWIDVTVGASVSPLISTLPPELG